jgi:DNA-binding response OmpR family regulator
MAKVMLVEDDPTMISLLNTLLEIEGFEVAQVKDFSKVLQEIPLNSPDLILLDVHLKDVNGLDILVDIRKDTSLNDISVIVSSGMDFKEESLSKGANDFVLKPYMPDELIDKIKKLI